MIDAARDLLIEQLTDDLRPIVRLVVAIATECIERETLRIVACRGIRDRVPGIGCIPAEQQIGDRREREVSAHDLLLLVVVGQHAVFVGAGAGHEVAQRVSAAGNGEGHATLLAVAEPWIDEEVARRPAGARHAACGKSGKAIGKAVAIQLRDGITERGRLGRWPEFQCVREAAVELHAPLRLTGVAGLGEDLDHARRRFGAVQGGGRGALDDLDALDVVGIDVVQRARDVIAAAEIRSRGGNVLRVPVAAKSHAIHIDERLIAHRDAHVAAESDHRARAGTRGAGHHRHAGRAPLKQLTYVLRRLRHLGHVDLGDRVAHFALARSTGCAGDDDGVELEDLLAQGEILGNGLAGDERERALDGTIAQHLGTNAVLPDRQIAEGVAAVVGRERAERRVDEPHLRSIDGLAVLTDHTPGNGGSGRLCADGGAADQEGRRHRPRVA